MPGSAENVRWMRGEIPAEFSSAGDNVTGLPPLFSVSGNSSEKPACLGAFSGAPPSIEATARSFPALIRNPPDNTANGAIAKGRNPA